ncbi:uncharacterized protein LOC121856080 [Homarus americanus]|uniref:uncharacterized protein LOC121856080 n=1 Tax=Homarus americanus TaxID=6706 RepID=UPI001C4397A4|nr:uncharacterized protein LOC121856080 [Homarus americanus]
MTAWWTRQEGQAFTSARNYCRGNFTPKRTNVISLRAPPSAPTSPPNIPTTSCAGSCGARTRHALRTHPALEGTACAVKKFCINGQCVSKPAKATQSKTTATVDTTTKPPNNRKKQARSANNIPTTSSPSGFSGIFRRMKDFFKRYLFLSGGLPRAVFTSQWVLTNLTECTAECGGGWRENLVTCTAAGGAVPLSDEMCDPFSRPPVKASCNTTPCSRPSVPSSSSESGRAINFPSGTTSMSRASCTTLIVVKFLTLSSVPLRRLLSPPVHYCCHPLHHGGCSLSQVKDSTCKS